MRKKSKRKHKPAAQTHRVAKSYTNGRRWVITEEPKEQALPDLAKGAAWHVVRVGTKREDINELRLRAKGFATFAPRYVRTASRQGQKHVSEPVLVPGYLFVASDGSEAEQAKIMGVDVANIARLRTLEWHDPRTGECFQASVKAVPMQVECVILRSRATNQPISVPKAVMDRFVGLVSKSTKEATRTINPTNFAPGATVRVTDGPFASFLAEVEAVDNGLARILVEIFGGKSSVELPIEAVEPA